MNVSQIMTVNVATVGRDTSLKDVALLLVEHRISGLPVCDEAGHVVGVVSEGDILWKEIGLAAGPATMIGRILNGADGDDQRLDARTAGDAMTSPTVTISPTDSVAEAARLMIHHRVNRLPVVLEGALVGIVTRADLVRAFVRPDEAIQHEISEDVLLRTLWIDPDTITLTVENGNVTIVGEVDNRSTAELVETYVRRIPGVVSVTSLLRWTLDDHAKRTAMAAADLPRRL